MTFLEGVYWDLDGTIANTELEAHLPAFNRSFKDFGLNWIWDKDSYVDLLRINGGKNRIKFFSSHKDEYISNELVNKIHERKQYHYLNLINANSVNLKKGVYRLISELKSKKVRQFIVTSSSKIQVNLLIKKLFLGFNPFEFIISSENVSFHKPNPEPYLKAICLSGIKPSRSLVFEDSNSGLRAALEANLPTIYCPSNIPTVIDQDIILDCIIISEDTSLILG